MGNKIGGITTAGMIAEYPVPTVDCSPLHITSWSDGALWFTDFADIRIGRITKSGAFTEYALPTDFGGPSGISSGSDGGAWFTASEGNYVWALPRRGHRLQE